MSKDNELTPPDPSPGQHFHAGDSSPCDKEHPSPGSEAEREANKIVGDSWREFGLMTSPTLVSRITSALARRDQEIADLSKGLNLADAAITSQKNLVGVLRAHLSAARKALAYGIADDESDDPDTRYGRWRIQARAALASTSPGEPGGEHLPTFTALGDPVEPGGERQATLDEVDERRKGYAEALVDAAEILCGDVLKDAKEFSPKEKLRVFNLLERIRMRILGLISTNLTDRRRLEAEVILQARKVSDNLAEFGHITDQEVFDGLYNALEALASLEKGGRA